MRRSRRFQVSERMKHVHLWLLAINDSGSKGKAYVDRLRYVARERMQTLNQRERDGVVISEAVNLQEQAAVKTIVEKAQKSLIRSKIKGRPWFPPISRAMRERLGSTQNQYCKWLGESIMAGDPRNMAPLLLQERQYLSESPMIVSTPIEEDGESEAETP